MDMGCNIATIVDIENPPNHLADPPKGTLVSGLD
jgi:hypothetical protein